MQYWPMAEAIGLDNPLFTCSGFSTENEAKQVIDRWKDQFNLTKAWIDQIDDNGNKKTIDYDLKRIESCADCDNFHGEWGICKLTGHGNKFDAETNKFIDCPLENKEN